MKNKKILFVLALMIILLIVFIEPIRAILIVVLLSIAGLAVFVSPFPLIIGILRLFFIKIYIATDYVFYHCISNRI
ncbi:hypothetical protein [Flavobacterium columnare]|uniref:hypothetical protein n=1 Tax=Flavobacterium columnare TaxID=996 RepID=UPI001BC86C79|nr:hypothetical protein [Flavobacterium columnare]